jgi:transposase InsO family protein
MVRRVAEGQSRRDVATSLRLSPKTVRKWLRRAAEQPGRVAALWDRSSRPRAHPRQTGAGRRAEVMALRERRLNYDQIAELTKLSKPTICRILRQEGMNRLPSLTVPEPVVRYERARPGELLHFDIKKLGRIEVVGHRITGDRSKRARGAGWEYLHVVIDDHTRIAFAAVLPSESKESAVPFLEAALAFYAQLGVSAERVMTDNGSCYCSRSFALTCVRYNLRHLRTRPYRPKTNGKAERFIQTIVKGWAHGQKYAHSDERKAHLLPWLHRYNWHRPHHSLKKKTPISRLQLDGDNLLRLHI